MKLQQLFITTSICLLSAVVYKFLIPPLGLWAQSSSVISATVKISICGNGIKEGGEDCDQNDLFSQTCITQGYGGGTLSCDISCSFEYGSCINPTPTPAATHTPAPTATATVAPTSTDIPTNIPTATPLSTIVASPTATPLASVRPSSTPLLGPLPRTVAAPSPYSRLLDPQTDTGKTGQVSELPLELTLFDNDNSGVIESKEIFISVKSWVEQWKKQDKKSFSGITEQNSVLICDLDKDGACTVKDFSLLMYHVDR